jgi:hypothetical protein
MLPVSLCCSFLIVPSVYSSVYFVTCRVYPMFPVSLCCSFLIVSSVYSSVYCVLYQEWTTQRHWQHRTHKIRDKINTRVNRRDNQEWTAQRIWQHRIHKKQDTINTRVNRRESLLFTLVFIVSCVLCIRCCQCLWIVYSWLVLRFSLTSMSEILTTSDTQDTGQNKH